MSDGIVIIGSGFAARQLVKNIRKQDAQIDAPRDKCGHSGAINHGHTCCRM
ncbi:TPA: hypothetical protein MDN70_005393 [Klebsiella pneumoniae]|nr:hypothetical protein [Klebsiella pneumoniae]